MTTQPASQPANAAFLPVVSIVDNHVTALSTDVAAYFGKDHKHVIRDIENILSLLPSERKPNFGQTLVTRANPSKGAPIKSKAYRMTRDGFTLLVMGWTGEKALHFKLAWLDAFNAMERQLYCGGIPIPGSGRITPTEQKRIRYAVEECSKQSRMSHQFIFSLMNSHFCVKSYKDLRSCQMDDVMAYLDKYFDEYDVDKGKMFPRTLHIEHNDAEHIRQFIYKWQYLYRDEVKKVLSVLNVMGSSMAPRFYEMAHDLNLCMLERVLDKYGYGVKDLNCYRYFMANRKKLGKA